MYKVYFITDGEYIKIGLSLDIQKRLKALQTSNPKKLELLTAFDCDNRMLAERLEYILHLTFKQFRVEGEWFNLDWPNAQAEIVQALGAYHQTLIDEEIAKHLWSAYIGASKLISGDTTFDNQEDW